MKVNRKKLFSLLICIISFLSHISCSLEKIKLSKTSNSASKRVEKRTSKKSNPNQQKTNPSKIDNTWLSQKFKEFEKSFENHKTNYMKIYTVIMFVIGFFSNLPEALIDKLENKKGIASVLKLLKSFATLFANIRSVSAECISGFEELVSIFSFLKINEKISISEESISCEINKASKNNKIKNFQEESSTIKLYLAKIYYDIPEIIYEHKNENQARLLPNLKTDIKASSCQEVQKAREANTINVASKVNNLFQLKYDYSLMNDFSIFTPNTYINKNINELKAEFKNNKENFFKDFNIQTELRIEAMADPSNYMLTWRLKLYFAPIKNIIITLERYA